MAETNLDSTDISNGVVIGPGEGKLVQVGPEVMLFKVVGEQTGGRFTLMSRSMAPESPGPALHSHDIEDEVFYIVEGALLFQLGDRLARAEAGSFVYCPRGSVHTFCNPYKQEAKVIGFMTPAGFEGFFEEFAAYLRERKQDDPIDPQIARAIGEKYHSKLMGPPMSLHMYSGE
jgi:mannose-6-phosphate isomerase-like protein (cupin superfamily)